MANISIPLGYKYKFEPEDHELMAYLSCKANGKPLACDGVIKEIDLYRLNDPGKLFERTQEKVVYIFTKLKKVAENGKRVERKVIGNRTWKGIDGSKPIYDKIKGLQVGEKKSFIFVNEMKMKLGYNMKEFALDKDNLCHAKFKDYVLCQIKRKADKKRSQRHANLLEEDVYSSIVSIPAIKEELDASSPTNVMPYPLNAIPFPLSKEEPAEQYCQFSELQGGLSEHTQMMKADFDIGSMPAFNKALTSLGFVEPSADKGYQY